jgi:hypothetical protein
MLARTVKRQILAGLLLGAVSFALPIAASLPAAAQAQPQAPAASAPAPQGVSPAAVPSDVVTVLERMGKTLAAPQFSFKARTVRSYAGPNGELLHVEHVIKTTLRRPDRLAVESTGDDGTTRLFYDGKTVTLVGDDPKQYAQAQAPNTIAGLIDFLIDKLGADMPLADLLVDSPAGALLSDIVSGGQVGTATIDGTKVKHFFFNQLPDVDLELWLEDNERAVPRRIYIVYRSLPGRPNFVADLSEWDFSTQLADNLFVFQPPAGATRVELRPRGSAAPASAR